MTAIERDNPALKDVLPKDYARPALDKARLGQVVDLVSNIKVGGAEELATDVLGGWVVSRVACKLGKGLCLPVGVQMADGSEDYPLGAG